MIFPLNEQPTDLLVNIWYINIDIKQYGGKDASLLDTIRHQNTFRQLITQFNTQHLFLIPEH